jgi:dipeptide transport system substrate-binding protein
MGFPNTEDWPAIRKHPDVRVIDIPGVNVAYLSYNVNKPPFNDVRVRKALNMAVNKRAIVDRVYEGLAVPAVSLIPPNMWSYNSQIKDEPYNPKAAQKLLAEAGFSKGFTTDLWVMPVARPYMPNATLMAELIRADWAKIGVNVEFKTAPWADYLKRVYAGEHQTALLGWTGSHGDPDYFFYNLLSCDTAAIGGANISKFCNPTYDALILKARQLANPALRIPLYEEAQRIFKEQAPWLTMAHSVQSVIHRKEVINLRLSPFGGRNFYGVELK